MAKNMNNRIGSGCA
jgi:hypothetical protein